MDKVTRDRTGAGSQTPGPWAEVGKCPLCLAQKLPPPWVGCSFSHHLSPAQEAGRSLGNKEWGLETFYRPKKCLQGKRGGFGGSHQLNGSKKNHFLEGYNQTALAHDRTPLLCDLRQAN